MPSETEVIVIRSGQSGLAAARALQARGSATPTCRPCPARTGSPGTCSTRPPTAAPTGTPASASSWSARATPRSRSATN